MTIDDLTAGIKKAIRAALDQGLLSAEEFRADAPLLEVRMSTIKDGEVYGRAHHVRGPELRELVDSCRTEGEPANEPGGR